MREKIIIVVDIFITVVLIILLNIFLVTKEKCVEKDEQIKILEQSLNEQIQEKEVYMKMLELKGEE